MPATPTPATISGVIRSPALPATALGLALALLGACSGGAGPGTPIGGNDVVPELLVCRSRVQQPLAFTEMALRTVQNLGTDRVSERNGIERRARLHPDGVRVVFARERQGDDPASRELFVATVDGSAAELRLTVNAALDDEPCWSPDGESILFTSDRDGRNGLWLMDARGQNQREFFTPPVGETFSQADWSPATDRVVYVRERVDGVHELRLVNGDGTGDTALSTAAGAILPGDGDFEPAFAPDGQQVVFARRTGGTARLMLIDIGTGVEVERLQVGGGGDIGLPRFSPTADRLFFGLDEPLPGRDALRLAFVPLLTGDPVLVWPDERYALEGLDFLANVPELPLTEPAVELPVEEAEFEIAWGSIGFGNETQLVAEDGNAYALRTRSTNNHETAGMECRFTLPVDDALDVAQLQIRAALRTTRIGGDTELRISLYNPVESRFDTAVELAPTSTTQNTILEFSTSSLRHVAREGVIRFNVIAEIERGDPAEMLLDAVRVVLTTRQPPP